MSVSKNTVVAPELRTASTSRAMSFADGSASGREPLERNLLEPVPGREIAERGMACDDLAARAVGEAPAVLAVERVEPAARRAAGASLAERDADQPHHLGVAKRIEPHVGIARGPRSKPSFCRSSASTSSERPLRVASPPSRGRA